MLFLFTFPAAHRHWRHYLHHGFAQQPFGMQIMAVQDHLAWHVCCVRRVIHERQQEEEARLALEKKLQEVRSALYFACSSTQTLSHMHHSGAVRAARGAQYSPTFACIQGAGSKRVAGSPGVQKAWNGHGTGMGVHRRVRRAKLTGCHTVGMVVSLNLWCPVPARAGCREAGRPGQETGHCLHTCVAGGPALRRCVCARVYMPGRVVWLEGP